jgi:hypothetical protein
LFGLRQATVLVRGSTAASPPAMYSPYGRGVCDSPFCPLEKAVSIRL